MHGLIPSSGVRLTMSLVGPSHPVLDGFKVVRVLAACTAVMSLHNRSAGSEMLQSFSGASVTRVIDPSHTCVPQHAHVWPVLSLVVIGSY